MHKVRLKFLILLIYYTSIYGMESKELSPIIEHVLKSVKEKNSKIPLFVGVAGCSGVGKSYFSEMLTLYLEKVGINCKILEEDDFKDPDFHENVFFHPHFNYEQFHSFLLAIKGGEQSLSKPRWIPWNFRPPDKTVEEYHLDKIDIVLINGEFILCDKPPYDFKKYLEFGILIDSSDENIIEWDWERGRDDLQKTTKKSEFSKEKKKQLEVYRDYLKNAQSSSDYVIIKLRNHEFQLLIRGKSQL